MAAVGPIHLREVEITSVVTVIPKQNETIPSDTLTLYFASSNVDYWSGREKPLIQCEAKIERESDVEYKYVASDVKVPGDFGDIGAVIVEVDENSSEKFILTISAEYSPSNSIIFSCNSWVQPRNLDPHRRRVFFSTKSYLPEQTPGGLVKLREEDLANLRGQRPDGKEDMEERKVFERIYNYDVYNDLGDPDEDLKWKRPVLGGSDHPYPRRCRTGRPMCVHTDPASESRTDESFYVPRDESFSEVKQSMFPMNPGKKDRLGTAPFSDFTQIDLMFRDGIPISPAAHRNLNSFDLSPALYFQELASSSSEDHHHVELETTTPTPSVIKFQPPEALKRDKFNWLSDSEFARQTLAGLNPYTLQLVTSWPLMSKLPAHEYGPPESAFTDQQIEKLIGCSMTVKEAIAEKKLFVLDYHDTFLEYVREVRGVKGTTLYGSRTLFFLNPDQTLRPLAIELTRPPMDGKPQWKQVFTPGGNATGVWLWRLAKAHVLAHDSCFHQVIVHWLRTHCSMEPYAIATNRQLSTMHPIYRLLHPHFRFTLRINSNAREILINAGGIIESTFSTAKYSMELSSLVYKKEWQFDLQGLPNDLIHRGMAVEDKSAPHGLKLSIEDYPFANDGLILWDALKEWVAKYVHCYYRNAKAVQNDSELQAWWEEIKEKGHQDKKKERGWPNLRTQMDLIEIVTTIAWVGCGHHSAVNFVQYAHAAYFPSRPSIARTNMPTEDSDRPPEELINKPESLLLQSFPSVAQASTVAQTMLVLSAHSPDEQYVGQNIEPSWQHDQTISEAFDDFKAKLEELEKTINDRNEDSKLKNRRGAGVVPYEVLKPSSTYGITGKGVPYSVST